MRLLLIIGIFTLVFQVSQGQKSNVDEERLVKDTIDGVYIPKNLDDSFIQIDSFWNDSTRTQVKNWTVDEFIGKSHFGIGIWMRNNWGLWGGSRLSKFFNDLGIYHPDDMSGIILTSYHRRLNGLEVDLNGQIDEHKAYWQKIEDFEKNIKAKFNNLNRGDFVQIPMSGSGGWRYDGTDRTSLTLYSVIVEDSRKFNCVVEGTVMTKRKKKGSLHVRIKITDLVGCEYKNPILNKKEVSVGKRMEIDMSLDKVIIN